MKNYLSILLFNLGDWYSILDNTFLFNYNLYNWIMTTSFKLDSCSRVWIKYKE